MKHIARALASQGRGPDTELLHVSRNELKHLAGLAGLKELPRNPKTGLPEAGLFESVLPIVGGIAGGMIGGPWGAALGSGLGTGLGGGSQQDMLRNAAVGGIGAYALGPAANAVDTAPATAVGSSAANTAATEATGQAAAATPVFDPTELTPQQLSPGASIGAYPEGAAMPYSTPGVTATNLNAPVAPPVSPAATPSMWDKTKAWVGEHPVQAGILGLGAASALAPTPERQKRRIEEKGRAHSGVRAAGPQAAPGANPYAERTYFANNAANTYTQDPSTYRYDYAEGGEVQPEGYKHTQFQSTYQPGLNTQIAPETQSAAMQAAYAQPAGGIASLPAMDPDWYGKSLGAPDTAAVTTPGSANYGQFHGAAQLGLAPFTAGLSLTPGGGDFVHNTMGSIGLGGFFAKGGELNLRGPRKSLDPVFLKGAGDGMSDSIPANIDGQEPIRVASGEFIVPSDVVSHLGNGDSNAGAKQLHGMMDRVRKAKTGKKKQAPQFSAGKYLPA